MFPQSFEDYLKTNYEMPDDRQVLSDVGNFLLQYPFPEEIDEHLNILRIKFLTKIASHGVDNEMSLISGINYTKDVVEAAARYCKAGIERVESGAFVWDGLRLSIEDVVKMHGHLYSHLGEFEMILAMEIQDLDKKKKMLFAAKNHISESIRISQQVEAEHPAYQFMFKAKVALALAEICVDEEKRSLMIEAAHDLLEGGRRSEQFDPSHSAYQYTFAADHFYNAALITADINRRNELLINAFEAGKKGAELVRQINPTHWAITCGNIGKFAEALYDYTGDDRWRKTAIHYYALVKNHFNLANEYLHVRDAMHAKIMTLRGKNHSAKPDVAERKVETKFIKHGKERHRVSKQIEDELNDLGY
ncbi:MAG: hypothetical protein QXT19_01640 [Candidatus Woesearchaeota archaeon]